MNIKKRLRQVLYRHKERAASATGLLAVIGLAGFGALYFGGQTSKTGMLIQEAKQNKYQVEARRINLSNFALAQSLLSYKSLGSGLDRHLESALYPADYFDAAKWDLELNNTLSDQSNTWSWDNNQNILTVRTPVDGLIDDQVANQIMAGGQRLSDVRDNQEAVSRLSFSNVQFDSATGYLAISIDALSETRVPAENGQVVVVRDRARIPLSASFSYKPRLQIRAPDGRELDSVRDAGKDSTANNPFPVGDVRFRLFGSGLISRGSIYWAQGDLASVGECLAVPARCHRYTFDSTNFKDFFNKRQHNVLAKEQLIGEVSAPFDLVPVVLKHDGKGKAKGNGAMCQVDADDDAENEKDKEQFYTVYTEKEYTAFGVVCGVDISQCTSTRIKFFIDDPAQKDVTAADVKRICSSPEEKPICVDGGPENDYFLPTYNRGVNKDDKFEMIFSAQHWDGWTQKMGYRQMKICIDGNDNLTPVAANCPAKIASVSDACWQANYGNDWTKNRIFYVNPTTCEPEFLFRRTACGCFTEDTLILLADGTEKKISDLSRNDKILNPVRKNAMTIKRMVVVPEDDPLIHITTARGVIKVTKFHPFPTDQGIKAAFRLKKGETIFLRQERGTQASKVLAVESVRPEVKPDVWNLELAGDGTDEDHFLVADGVVTGDLSIQSRIQQQEESLAKPVARTEP